MSLILVFLIIFLPRLWILLNSSYTFYSDDAIYATLANSWRTGAWQYVFHPFWPPLYPAISALFLSPVSYFEIALRQTSIIFGTAVIIPLFFLTLIYLIILGIFKLRTKQYFLSILYFIIIFLITISPYVIATRWQIGEWSISQKFSAQIQQGHAYALNNRNTTWAQEIYSAKYPNYKSPYFKNGDDFLLDRLYYFLHIYNEKQLRWTTVFLSIFPIWVIPIILIGIIYLLNKKYSLSIIYLFFILITSVPITIFSTSEQDVRYLAWTIPIFLYFLLLGIRKTVNKNYTCALLLFLAVFFPRYIN